MTFDLLRKNVADATRQYGALVNRLTNEPSPVQVLVGASDATRSDPPRWRDEEVPFELAGSTILQLAQLWTRTAHGSPSSMPTYGDEF